MRLAQEIETQMAKGYHVITENATVATMMKPKKISIGWLVFWCCTLVGWIPYLGYHFLMKREHTIRLTSTPTGDVKVRSHSR